MKLIAAKFARAASCAVALVALCPAGALADAESEVAGSGTFSSSIKLDQPIDINMEVNGVKLASVYFDKEKLQAFVILQNRTPQAVLPKVGVALFDAKGRLLATGLDVTAFSFSGDKVGAGDQKNLELGFGKFINDYRNVKTFQAVLSVGKAKEAAAVRTGPDSR